MANVIQTTIELDLDKLRGQLKTAESDGEASGKKAGKGFGDEFEKGAGKALGSLKGQIIAVGAALLGAFGAKAVIQAASQQEDAINSLNSALRSAGSFSQAASADLQNFASQLQKTTIIGDETSLKMLALAKSFGASNDQSKELVKAAANMSAALGIDLETATRQLGMTLQGSAGRLGLVVQGMKNLTPEALKAGGALALVNSRFAGMAEAQTRTFSGALAQMKNAFGDIAEELGMFITKSPAVIAILNLMAKKFSEVADAIHSWAEGGGIEQVTATALQIAQVFTAILGPAIEFVINAFQAAGQALGGFVAALTLAASGEFSAAGEAIKTAFADGFDALTDFSGSAKANQFVQEFVTSVETAKPVMQESGRSLASALGEGVQSAWPQLEDFKKGFLSATTEMSKATMNLGSQMRQTFAMGMVNSFAAFGSALAKGENGFEAFGKAMLGVLGDMAIQAGAFFFSLGLAKIFIPDPTGAPLMAAGIALSILGGALKGLSGGGGGAPATAGGIASTPTGSQGGVPVAAAVPEEINRREGGGPRVEVNIHGNVLDRRQTGLELAEVINEAVAGGGISFSGAGGS